MESILPFCADFFLLLLLTVGAGVLLCANLNVWKRERKLFAVILGLLFLFSISTSLENTLHTGDVFRPMRLVFSVFDYSIKPFIALLFYLVVTPDAPYKKWLWLLPGADFLLYCTAFFSQWVPGFPNLVLYFSSDNHFCRGKLCFASVVLCGGILLLLLAESFYRKKQYPPFYKFLICAIVFANVGCGVIEIFAEGLLLFPCVMLLSFIFYYVYLCYLSAQAHEREIVTQNQIDIMVSQIQPHFLYNTLNSIYHLCDIDAKKAQKTIDEFSTYLRSNLRSLGQTAPIPFEEELAHTKTYVEIEKLRFGDRVNAEFHIAVSDFELPPLTLQPLVENAIKHGICQKEEGGTVCVSTESEGNFVILRVKDNGVGFDTSLLENKSGIGFHNVQNRLERMGVGSLSISSTPGVGTEVIMRLKKTV